MTRLLSVPLAEKSWRPPRMPASTEQYEVANQVGTPINASPVADAATPHTMGAWVQLVSSAPVDFNGFWLANVNTLGLAASDGRAVLHIGIGAAASEVTVARLNVGEVAAQTVLFVPLFIPKGSRISLALQAAALSATATFWVTPLLHQPFDRKFPSSLVPTEHGLTLASSKGVTVARGAAGEGSWVEIVAATSQPYRGLLVLFGNDGDTVTSNSVGVQVDIGIGAAGSERVIIPNVLATYTQNEAVTHLSGPGFYDVWVPKGARLAARMASTNSANNAADVVLYGIPA